MKFNVGDLLIDNGNAGDEPVRNAVVIDEFVVFGEGYYYTLQYSNGEVVDFSRNTAEFVWMVAPKGSVAWLIHQLSALPQLAPVNYFVWDDINLAYYHELVESAEYNETWERVDLW